MILTFLDTETTGVSPEKGDRIIEACFVHVDFVTGLPVGVYEQRFKPDVPIDPEAQKVHGISMADLEGCPTFADKAEEVSRELSRGQLLIAHNMDFDGLFLASELEKAGQKLPKTPTFCTMKNGRWACFDGKQPRLQELCFALGIPYDPALAHAALYDTQVMVECYLKAVKRGFFQQPKGIA